MSTMSYFLNNLAAALASGKWTKASLLARARKACLDLSRRLPRVVRLVLDHFPTPPPIEFLRRFLRDTEDIARLLGDVPHVVVRLYFLPETMEPQSAASARWRVPALATPDQLADWLATSINHLKWRADLKDLNRRTPATCLRHYRYRWIPKRRGRFRLVEAPKAGLKTIQRRLLHGLLDAIPAHPAAHGFRPGRSILSYAAPHVGKAFVIRFDLADFFPSVDAGRIQGMFRMAGYPLAVAQLLTGLCTTRTPEEVLAARPMTEGDRDDRWRSPFLERHLAQGAPTSPALANLVAYRLDVRLTALAKKLDANYTRYADDLAFSGGPNLRRVAKRLQTLVAVIAAEEGFQVNFRKCRFMSASVRQELAGVVVNEKSNGRRRDFDALKAILYNCVRHGPTSQNRDRHPDFRAHLRGRIAHWSRLRPERGRKLLAVFECIDWSSG